MNIWHFITIIITKLVLAFSICCSLRDTVMIVFDYIASFIQICFFLIYFYSFAFIFSWFIVTGSPDDENVEFNIDSIWYRLYLDRFELIESIIEKWNDKIQSKKLVKNHRSEKENKWARKIILSNNQWSNELGKHLAQNSYRKKFDLFTYLFEKTNSQVF
jgi:hypothetical protein